MLKTPANNELDSLKKLFVGVCQYQHVVVDEKDPLLIIFEDIVDYLHPLPCSCMKGDWNCPQGVTTDNLAEDIGPMRT